MSSPAEATIRTDSFQLDQNLFSATHSSSLNSYPDYAPPPYEVATAITTPCDESKPELTEVLDDGGPDTRPSIIHQAIEQATSRNPLDSLPLCFDRTATSDVPPEPLLQPFVVQSRSGRRFLDDAFEIVGTSVLEPYGVLSDDWVQMLEDIRAVAQLTKGQRVAAGCTGFFLSRAIQKGMRRRNAASVAGLLDLWDEKFFRRRGLEITLCRGDWRVSSTSACGETQLPAPDRPNAQPRQKGCCGIGKSNPQVFEQAEESLDGLSRCERRWMMRTEKMVPQRQKRLICSAGKEGYRLVAVPI